MDLLRSIGGRGTMRIPHLKFWAIFLGGIELAWVALSLFHSCYILFTYDVIANFPKRPDNPLWSWWNGGLAIILIALAIATLYLIITYAIPWVYTRLKKLWNEGK